MAPTHDSPTPVVALAVLSVAAALALTRVFGGHAWIAPLVVASVLPHAVVLVGGRRGWSGGALLATLAGIGFLLAVWTVQPHETFAGIPTPGAFAEITHRLGDAGHTLRIATVPVSPTGSALLLALVAAYATAACAGWMAQRLSATLGAIVPALVFFIVVSALGEGPWLWTVIAFSIASAAFLFAQHEALADRGRTWATSARPRRHRTVAAGMVLGTAAVLVGAMLTPQLPGADARGLMDYRDIGGGDGTGRLVLVSPLVDIRSQLLEPSPTALFRVKSSEPAYWRLIGLDQFDGRIWGLRGDSEPANEGLDVPAPRVKITELRQRFELLGLDRHLLPAAYRPTDVDFPDASVIVDSSTLVTDGSTAGSTYVAVSEVPSYTPDDLDDARRPQAGTLSELTELPAAFPPRVTAEAARIVAESGATIPYRQLLALQDHLRTFEYSLEVPAGHSDSDIERFLFETQAGYCEQFAGTFAAMARSLGFPARVAVGFTPGARESVFGSYVVTGHDAHAWPEVFLDGAGWVSFEPTPTRADPSPGDHTGTEGQGAPITDPSSASTTTTVASSAPSAPNDGPASLPPGAQISAGDTPAASNDGGQGVSARSMLAVLAGAGVIALALLFGPRLVGRVRASRLRRTRRRGDTRSRIHGAWDEALDDLARAGVPPRPAATPMEFALRHAAAAGAGSAGAPLVELARLETGARYAPETPPEEAATEAWQHADTIAGRLSGRGLSRRRGGSDRATSGPGSRRSRGGRRRRPSHP